MKTLLLSAAAAALLAGGASAQAFDQGRFHIGLGYSFLDLEDDSSIEDFTSESFEAEFDALTLRGGYDFSRFFGVEVDATFGLSEESQSFDVPSIPEDPQTLELDVDLNYLLAAFAKAQFPVNDQFSVFARAGFATAELEATATYAGETFSDDGSDEGFGLGVGAEWAFAGPNAVRADYTYYDFDGVEIDQFGVSYVRRF